MPTTPEQAAFARAAAQANRERIKARSKQVGVSPVFLERRFVIERFLWRLGHSEKWASRFTLKGGLVLLTLGAVVRPTDDADLHMEDPLSVDDVLQMATDVCSVKIDRPDGLVWMPENAKLTSIIDQSVTGVRIEFPVQWANEPRPSNTITCRLDLAWGGKPLIGVERPLPVVLPKNFAVFSLRMFPWEQVLAEKIHALARHGLATSRMKDFYDLVLIAESVDLDAADAARAIEQVFTTWGEPALSATLPILDSPEYPAQNEESWQRFIADKNDIPNPSPTLEDAVARLRPLISPLLTSIANGGRPRGVWEAGSGRWTFFEKPGPRSRA